MLARPSWWTVKRLLWLVTGLGIAVAAGAGWVWTLRKRIRQQTAVIQRKSAQEAVSEERQRIARDFHDTLQQDLIGIMMQFDTTAAKLPGLSGIAAESLDLARQMIRRSIAEIRAVVWDMHCRPLLDGGLPSALAAVTQTRTQGNKVPVLVNVVGAPRRLPTDVETQLLRIAEEAVSNALKHSGATMIEVELGYREDSVRLRVADDGRGFDAKGAEETKVGYFGLLSMRGTAETIGGGFLLRSEPGEGTEIEVVVS